MNKKSELVLNQKILIPPHCLANIEIQKYYQNGPRFIWVYSRDNLFKNVKDGPYEINLDEHANIETHWITLYASNNDVFFLSFWSWTYS